MEMRPYQKEAVDTIYKGWPEYPRQILSSFTGSGKTYMGSELAKRELIGGGSVLWLCNRNELVRQAVGALTAACGLEPEVDRAESRSENGVLVVGSVPSMINRLGDQPYTMVVADECHFLPSDSYSRVVSHYVGQPSAINEGGTAKAKLLGLSATPGREDKKELGIWFDRIGYQYGIPEGIRDQWIPPIKYERLDVAIDMEGVKTVDGEFDASQVAARVHPVFEKVVKVLAEKLKGNHKTLIFVPLVEQSKLLASRLEQEGIKVRHVDGETDDIEHILDNFRTSGSDEVSAVNCLVNSQLLSFGTDLPNIDTLVFLKPVKSKVWYQQALGRGLRVWEGKEYLRVLDFVWLSTKGELMTPFTLTVGAEAAAEAEKLSKENPDISYGEAVSQGEAVTVQRSFIAELELAILQARNMKAKFPVLMDAKMYAFLAGDQPLAQYEPGFGWERNKPSVRQLQALERFRIDPRTVPSMGFANRLINKLVAMKTGNRPTAKQLYWLARIGVKEGWRYSRELADQMIEQQKAKWQEAKERRQYWASQR